jgi:hypothetical protein
VGGWLSVELAPRQAVARAARPRLWIRTTSVVSIARTALSRTDITRNGIRQSLLRSNSRPTKERLVVDANASYEMRYTLRATPENRLARSSDVNPAAMRL